MLSNPLWNEIGIANNRPYSQRLRLAYYGRAA